MKRFVINRHGRIVLPCNFFPERDFSVFATLELDARRGRAGRHQANKAMVTSIAEAVGLDTSRLYFDIDRVGNTSSASIPLALHDAVRDGVLTRPTRVFAPGFGAGAVGGYLVARIAPSIVG